ncbi:MAG: methyltransferase domain-containing protein [Alphaproteobacteria bacterium]|nr:methyltransferase domain-containing protein [Alphaproteobacteria bacterium]
MERNTAGAPGDTAFVERAPSDWVRRFAPLIAPGGRVLDIAAGRGRHSQLLVDLGHPVVAIDRDVAALAAAFAAHPTIRVVQADLEDGSPWPLDSQSFAGIVVTNYLYRPLFPRLIASLAASGVLIYETFALGNARFGPPRNPAFLLADGELLQLCAGLHVVAYENGNLASRPAVIQRICAVRPPEHAETFVTPLP